jgi:hypothetical protein
MSDSFDTMHPTTESFELTSFSNTAGRNSSMPVSSLPVIQTSSSVSTPLSPLAHPVVPPQTVNSNSYEFNSKEPIDTSTSAWAHSSSNDGMLLMDIVNPTADIATYTDAQSMQLDDPWCTPQATLSTEPTNRSTSTEPPHQLMPSAEPPDHAMPHELMVCLYMSESLPENEYYLEKS